MISVAYAGTRVIEIASGLSAGVAGRFFADLGADVVRFESFEVPPSDPGELAALTWARARKRVISTADVGRVGIGHVEPLLAGADVLLTDLSPRRWRESFPSLEAISDIHPGIVILDIPRFGRVGPYADYVGTDLVLLALSGYLFTCGLNDREPLRLGVDMVDIATGVNAAGGAMVGLHHARRTGQGQVVEVSDASHDALHGDEFSDQLLVSGHRPASFVDPDGERRRHVAVPGRPRPREYFQDTVGNALRVAR